MRVTKYTLENKDMLPVLVKESAVNYECDSLTTPGKIVVMMNHLFHASTKAEEYGWILALNTRNRVVGIFEISHGTINEAPINPREIFCRLFLCNAVGFVLIHNHPSGYVDPSRPDFNITKRIKDTADLMGFVMLDHIIIGEDNYFSFSEKTELFDKKE